MSLIEIFTLPIFNLIVWLFSLLPTISLPMSFFTAMDTGTGYLSTMGYFVSLPTLASIITIYLAYYFFKLIFNSIPYLLTFIPFIKMGKR